MIGKYSPKIFVTQQQYDELTDAEKLGGRYVVVCNDPIMLPASGVRLIQGEEGVE